MRNYIGENILAFRISKGLSQEQIAELADVSQAAVSSWELGKTVPRRSNLAPLVAAFPELDYDDLLSCDAGFAKKITRHVPPVVQIEVPLYGSIAAGQAIEMLSDEGVYPIPAKVHAKYPRAFLLRVRGESMNRVLPNGSLALVDPTPEVIDGKIYAMCIGSSDATIKRVRKVEGGFNLMPESTIAAFWPKKFRAGDSPKQTVRVIGRVVWYCLPPDFEL